MDPYHQRIGYLAALVQVVHDGIDTREAIRARLEDLLYTKVRVTDGAFTVLSEEIDPRCLRELEQLRNKRSPEENPAAILMTADEASDWNFISELWLHSRHMPSHLGIVPREKLDRVIDLGRWTGIPTPTFELSEAGRVLNEIAIIDLQFLVELLSFGVYWSIFDSLPNSQREIFKQLWGRLFELYVVDLLNAVYSPSSKMLYADVEFEGGQIDALIDCSSEIVLFEVKSSILTENAKRSGDRIAFETDVRRKFIENEKGKPKALKQLARSAEAILNGKVGTKATVRRIYPVMISDEPSVEAFGFNTYLDGLFQKEVGSNEAIRPLTVMHIQELEEFLAYAQNGTVSWSQLLETRFKSQFSVSIRQELYDFRAARSIPLRRNEQLLKWFAKLGEMIGQRYRGA